LLWEGGVLLLSSDNKIIFMFIMFGFISIIIGIQSSTLLFQEHTLSNNLQTALGMFSLIIGIAIGLLLIGVAKIIHLLEKVQSRSNEEFDSNSDISPEEGMPTYDDVDPSDRNEIIDYFHNSNKSVHSIKATNKPFIYIVDVEGENLTVETGGFQLRVLD